MEKFICPLTKYSIEYFIDITKKTAYMNEVECDYVNIKAFLLLLRNSVDKLITNGINKIIQYVSIYDWDNYLKDKTTWKIENKFLTYLEISCDIDSFLRNLSIGMGLKN